MDSKKIKIIRWIVCTIIAGIVAFTIIISIQGVVTLIYH